MITEVALSLVLLVSAGLLVRTFGQLQKVDLAMKNFAKAFLLKGNTSKAAKQYLDNLYKSSHQNTLVGLERVIAKAQEELQ